MAPLPNIDPPQLLSIDLLKPLKDFINWLIEQIVSLFNTLANAIKEHVITPIVNALNWVKDRISDTVKNFFTTLLNFLAYNLKPSDPERAINVMVTFASMGIGLSLGMNAILTVIGTKIAGTGINISPLSNMLNKIMDLRLLFSVTLGIITYNALRIPLGYWAKKFFRPYKPDPITLFGLYTRGYISRETLKSELAYVTGYPDAYVDGLIDIFQYNPSLFDLLRMADYVELSDELISKSLKILGVKEPFYSMLFTLIKRRPLREEIRSVITQLVYAYQDGYMSEEEFKKLLDDLKVMPMEKELILALAKNRRAKELKDRRIKILTTAFKKGLISEATLVSELEKLGLVKEFVNIILEDAKLGRKVEVPVPKITRAYSIEIPITTSYSYVIS